MWMDDWLVGSSLLLDSSVDNTINCNSNQLSIFPLFLCSRVDFVFRPHFCFRPQYVVTCV